MATTSGWNEPPLYAAFFSQSLNVEVLKDVACKETQVSLDELINMLIHPNAGLKGKKKVL